MLKKTLTNFRQSWQDIVKKGFDNYESLTADERVWFNVESLIGQVNNGGLISFYYNSGANHLNETVEDLIKLTAHEVADCLRQVNNLFPHGQPPINIDERNKIINTWEESYYDELINALDKKIFQLQPGLENSLVEHIQRKNLS